MNQYSTDMELIKYCANPPPEKLLGGALCGNKIVQISDQIVIKFGLKVTNAEAVNQSAVYNLVDPQIVRVPKVYRYFQTMKIEDIS